MCLDGNRSETLSFKFLFLMRHCVAQTGLTIFVKWKNLKMGQSCGHSLLRNLPCTFASSMGVGTWPLPQPSMRKPNSGFDVGNGKFKIPSTCEVMCAAMQN